MSWGGRELKREESKGRGGTVKNLGWTGGKEGGEAGRRQGA